jgi:hypothetical protein
MPMAPHLHDFKASTDVIRAAGRVTRFIARVDAHLPTLADDAARRALLDLQLEGWERRYARFVASDGDSEPMIDAADPPQAADFLLTLTGLAARRIAFGQRGTRDGHG